MEPFSESGENSATKGKQVIDLFFIRALHKFILTTSKPGIAVCAVSTHDDMTSCEFSLPYLCPALQRSSQGRLHSCIRLTNLFIEVSERMGVKFFRLNFLSLTSSFNLFSLAKYETLRKYITGAVSSNHPSTGASRFATADLLGWCIFFAYEECDFKVSRFLNKTNYP